MTRNIDISRPTHHSSSHSPTHHQKFLPLTVNDTIYSIYRRGHEESAPKVDRKVEIKTLPVVLLEVNNIPKTSKGARLEADLLGQLQQPLPSSNWEELRTYTIVHATDWIPKSQFLSLSFHTINQKNSAGFEGKWLLLHNIYLR